MAKTKRFSALIDWSARNEEEAVNPVAADADLLAARYVRSAGFTRDEREYVAGEYAELIREAYRAGEEFN